MGPGTGLPDLQPRHGAAVARRRQPVRALQRALASLAFRYGSSLYNYQGVRRYKDKFKPEWTGTYLAYPRGVWVPGLLIDIAALVSGGYRRFLIGGS
jgi:phosphatidylglycerol lysyltransferase